MDQVISTERRAAPRCSSPDSGLRFFATGPLDCEHKSWQFGNSNPPRRFGHRRCPSFWRNKPIAPSLRLRIRRFWQNNFCQKMQANQHAATSASPPTPPDRRLAPGAHIVPMPPPPSLSPSYPNAIDRRPLSAVARGAPESSPCRSVSMRVPPISPPVCRVSRRQARGGGGRRGGGARHHCRGRGARR